MRLWPSHTSMLAGVMVILACGMSPFFAMAQWMDMSNSTFTAHANFVPGLNVLGGIRYYVTERIAMFTEYKYNRATFDFVGAGAQLTFRCL